VLFYETALKEKVCGHLLQLIPFFLYLLQHLFFGLIQFDEHTASQALGSNDTIGVTFLCSV